MRGGPFREGRPTNNSRGTRPEPTRSAASASRAEASQDAKVASVREEDAAAPQAPYVQPTRRSKRRPSKGKLAMIILALLVLISTIFFFQFTRSTSAVIDGSKYQAVFFTNGNVYFGKLSPFNGEYMRLETVYYPQTQTSGEESQSAQQSINQNSNVTLIKLSDAIHGAEDEMMIKKDQIQFFQNLRDDSRVSQLIKEQN